MRGEYCADGTGIILAGGTSYPRTWEVQDDNSVCVISSSGKACYKFEQNAYNSTEYRAQDIETGKRTIITIMPGGCGGDIASGPLFKDWVPITDEGDIREILSNKVYEWDKGRAEYCADGTATVYAFGSAFERTWEVKNKGYCIATLVGTSCYSLEKHNSNPDILREKNLDTGEYSIFKVTAKIPGSCKQ